MTNKEMTDTELINIWFKNDEEKRTEILKIVIGFPYPLSRLPIHQKVTFAYLLMVHKKNKDMDRGKY